MIIDENVSEEVGADVLTGEEVEENENKTIPETPEETEEETETVPGEPADDEELIVSFGDEEPEEQETEKEAPAWVKEVRKKNRKLEKELRELKKAQVSTTENKPVTLGPKPTLAGSDYDSTKYETELENWYKEKRKVDEQTATAAKVKEEEQKAWQSKIEGYKNTKVALKVPDFEEAEHVAQELFSTTQQGIILQGAENSALLMYALGKNEKKAADLAKIKDPIQFAFAVAKMEATVKTKPRKGAPAPERTVKGSGGLSGGAVDSTLEKLRAEAAKTGDSTKVVAYKKMKRNKKRS